MEFQKLTAPSLKELFVREIENHIISGDFRIGEKLPSERELAESMQISRSVVNTGIAELAQKGFIEVRARSGNYVADYRREGTLDTLVSIMNYNGGVLPNDDIRSILHLRIALTNLATNLIVSYASDEQIEELLNYAKSGKELHSTATVVEYIYQFYHKLAIVSGNTLLPLIVCSFKEIIYSLTRKYVINYGPNNVIQNNIALVELLKTRNYEVVRDYTEKKTLESIHGNKEIYNQKEA